MDNEQKYIDLIKLKQESLNKRRDIELKYNFGIWAGIALVHTHLASGGYSYTIWMFIGYVAIFLLYASITLKFWHSNEREHKKIKGYEDEIIRPLVPPYSCFYKLFKHTIFWHLIYLIFTGVLLSLSFNLLIQKLIEHFCNFTNNAIKQQVCCHTILLPFIYLIIVIIFFWIAVVEGAFRDDSKNNATGSSPK